MAVAAALGGRELAAISGAVLAARQRGVPVLLDGFRRDVGGAAAGAARARHAGSLPRRTRLGRICHRDLLRELALDPLLDLDMRLGEASGAGVAILLLRAALACHVGMATFAEAGVSGAGD